MLPLRHLRLAATGLITLGFVLVTAGLPGPARAEPAWRWPLPAPVAVLHPFEAPTGPYGPGHRGVDLAASAGATVRAAGSGTVVVAARVAGTPVVVIAHGTARSSDELRTTYQPVETELVVGTRVAAGRALGRLGSWPGHCTRPCLHWGLRRGATYLDPTSLLDGPVRLLPVGAPRPLADDRSPARLGTAVAAPRDRSPLDEPTSAPRVERRALLGGTEPRRGASTALTAAGAVGGVAALLGAGAVAAGRRRARHATRVRASGAGPPKSAP